MKWLQVEISTTQDCADVISDMLINLGAKGVSVIDPKEIREVALNQKGFEIDENFLHNDDNAEVTVVTALKPHGRAMDAIHARLFEIKNHSSANFCGSLNVKTKLIDDQDWKNNFKKIYKPIQIGKLKIVPVIHRCCLFKCVKAAPDEVFINPGLGFGTGQHETTQMCIELMQTFSLAGKYVIDVGCGSGILALSALKLGAGTAECIDTDQQAIDATISNSKLNRLQNQMLYIHGEITTEGEKADLIVSNITTNIVMSLCNTFKGRLKPDGTLIVSGVSAENKDEFEEFYIKNGFEIKKQMTKGGWTAYKMKIKAENV